MIQPSRTSHTLQRVWLARLGFPLALHAVTHNTVSILIVFSKMQVTDLMNNDVLCWVLFSMCN